MALVFGLVYSMTAFWRLSQTVLSAHAPMFDFSQPHGPDMHVHSLWSVVTEVLVCGRGKMVSSIEPVLAVLVRESPLLPQARRGDGQLRLHQYVMYFVLKNSRDDACIPLERLGRSRSTEKKNSTGHSRRH